MQPLCPSRWVREGKLRVRLKQLEVMQNALNRITCRGVTSKDTGNARGIARSVPHLHYHSNATDFNRFREIYNSCMCISSASKSQLSR